MADEGTLKVPIKEETKVVEQSLATGDSSKAVEMVDKEMPEATATSQAPPAEKQPAESEP